MTTKVLDNFYLSTGDYQFVNWSHMKIKKSMLSFFGEFSFETFDYSYGDFDKWKIKIGDQAKAVINDVTICEGYITEIPLEYGDGNFSIQFIGTDKTVDLVDCNYVESNNEFKNQTILSIIKKLCSPFSIDVTIDGSVSEKANIKIATFKVNEGEFISDLILDICRDNGIVPVCLGDGKLTLTNATNVENTKDPIQLDANVERGQFIQTDRQRYSNYYVKGYGIGSDDKSLTDYIGCNASFKDSVMSRYRTITMFMDKESDNGRCKKRVQFESRIRAALSRYPKYKISSWVQSDGSVWQINKTVKVKDSLLGIDDTLLIIAAEYLYDVIDEERNIKETSTILTVVDKDIFSGSADDINIRTNFDA
jgi:prophage tail gpP-like protein